jgi:hypothetical protein
LAFVLCAAAQLAMGNPGDAAALLAMFAAMLVPRLRAVRFDVLPDLTQTRRSRRLVGVFRLPEAQRCVRIQLRGKSARTTRRADGFQ